MDRAPHVTELRAAADSRRDARATLKIVSAQLQAWRWSVSSVIVGGVRPPIGKPLGGFTDVSATDLGGYTMAATSERSGVALIITVPGIWQR